MSGPAHPNSPDYADNFDEAWYDPATDSIYASYEADSPMDLLTYVRAVHAFAKNRRVLDEALSGKYEHLDDIPDLF